MSKVIAIASERSRVGKTNLAINLAKELAGREKRVLIIDLDPQADSSRKLNFHRDYSIANLFNKSKNIADIVHRVEQTTLFIIPSNIKLINIEKNYLKSDTNFRLKEVTDYLRKKFEYIIYDLPPYIGHITATAVENSDTLISPIKVERFALDHTAKIFELSDILEKKINFLLTVDNNIEESDLQVVEQELRPLLIKSLGKPLILQLLNSDRKEIYSRVLKELDL